MSAPTPAPGDDSPREGYYPDPSIPGYVRYWNGASWVPGTSRPAPQQGEPLPTAPAGEEAAPYAAAPGTAAVDETGPVFFDEGPYEGNRPEPATAWQADASRQTGFGGERDRRVSWGGAPAPAPQDGPAEAGPRTPAGGTPDAGAPGGAGPAGRAPADPRRPAPADPTRGALPGMRDGSGQPPRTPSPSGSTVRAAPPAPAAEPVTRRALPPTAPSRSAPWDRAAGRRAP